MRGRILQDACSGAVSGPVRVSYFDPRTGEPCDEKPEPLHGDQERRSREREGYRESLSRGWKRRAVVVDGGVYESINAAARAMRADKTSLGAALRSGATEFRGHSVRYADPAQAPVASPNNARNSRAVVVDGERYASIADAADAYRGALDAGVRPEDARYMLPEATKTNLVVTMNWRELFHFLDLRTDKAAQWEIRGIAEAMVDALEAEEELAPMVAMWKEER